MRRKGYFIPATVEEGITLYLPVTVEGGGCYFIPVTVEGGITLYLPVTVEGEGFTLYL